MPNILSRLKRNFVYALAKRQSSFFLSRLKFAPAIQEKMLRKFILQANNTSCGNKMRLSAIKSVKDFQKNIPIHTYDDYSPSIDRIKRGEKNVLFPASQKLVMFALSSGTTEAPKFIPVTDAFFESYARGSLYWGAFMFLTFPGILEGQILPIVSSMSENTTQNGIPCGGISGLIVKSQRPVARARYFLPYSVYNIKDIDAKIYTILRLSLQKKNIRFISSANPSTLLALGRSMDRWKEDLIADIFDAGLKFEHNLPKDLVSAIKPRLKKDKIRAKELEDILRRTGTIKPVSAWPNLYLLSSWKGGTVGQYLSLLPQYYGDTPVYELGLLASEGRMSVPLNNADNQGVLDIYSNFYEFIPEEEEDNPLARTLLMNEVEKGKRYFIVLTTPYGFFRYHIHDLIDVRDFLDGVPVIAFLNKGKHISSLTGEKLTEFQVCEAIKNTGIVKGEEYTLVPCWDNNLPHYTLVVEEGHIKGGVSSDFLTKLDDELKNLNLEYRSKRESGRLGGIDLRDVPQNIFSKMKRDFSERQGGRLEQYKQVHLDTQKKIWDYIRKLP